jgi:hypothetical protein
MTVDVDLLRLLAHWTDDAGGMGDHCRLVFRQAAGPGSDDDALAAFTSAVLEANQRLESTMLDDGGIATGAPLPVRVPSGPACDVESRRHDALTAWLAAAATALEGAGWSGELAWLPFPPAPVRVERDSTGGVAAVLALSGWETATRARADAPWRNDDGLAGPLARLASTWLRDGDGPYDLATAMGTQVKEDDVEPLLHSALSDQEDRYGPSFWARRGSQRSSRSAGFDALGHVVLAACEETSVSNPVDEVIALATPWASQTDWIIVMEAAVASASFRALYNNIGRGRRLPRYYNRDRAQDLERLPDAFGWQIVTSRHLARCHDLSRWEITDLGHDRFVLSAPELDAWLAVDPRRPDEPRMGTARLEAARRDFGDVILWTDPP